MKMEIEIAERPILYVRPTLRLVSLVSAALISLAMWSLLVGCQSYQPPCTDCYIGVQRTLQTGGSHEER
ncbi:hypothetical protein C8J36_103554 [Rhizobium sp. PP-F2F-G48]|uniref:hypothetical protein n=1 Tax=Rhizobium sp. PP-F2F-G48 TaxID=2135651 RepID=UPI001051E4AC|nr:hypothetical protein [Rhizobium sp. PP-F2F-G48]TCM56184.1 hypothetical protein C8J36_103554 [Rhizobium sp. PP-F2F-G48]